MANIDKFKSELQAQPQQIGLEELIQKSVKELGKALPAHLNPERLVRIALTCIRLNPELAKCTPASFLGALFTSAQLGLEPIAGNAYLLPFNNKRQINGEWKTLKECQFIIGYKGLANLFYRHEKSVQLNWGVVKEKDEFDYQYGTNSYLNHKPAKNNRGELVGFYVIAELSNGGKSFMYMSYDECLEHGKKHSKTYDKNNDQFLDYSPWVTNTEAMCLKTVLIQLSKLLPLSIEFQRAISADETSREYRSGIDTALDLPDNTNWQEPKGEELPIQKEEAKQAPTPEPQKPMYELPPEKEIPPDTENFDNDIEYEKETEVEIPEVKSANITDSQKKLIDDLLKKIQKSDPFYSYLKLNMVTKDWFNKPYDNKITKEEGEKLIQYLMKILKEKIQKKG